MKIHVRYCLFWAPRILGFMFAAFISFFAIDVFSEGYGLLRTIFSLIVHLLPSFAIVIILVISWRQEWVGAILFIATGIIYYFYSDDQLYWLIYTIMSGIPILVGLLFMINSILKWFQKRSV
jgi:hypothetical protein